MPARKMRSKNLSLFEKFSQTVLHLFTPQRSNNHRPKLLHPDFLFYSGIILIGFFALIQTFRFFPSLKNGVLGFSSSITPDQVVAQTNQQRANLGLQPLVLSDSLSAAALAKAQDMLDHQYWAHTSPDGKEPWDFIKQVNYTYTVAGENLARDFHNTESMVSAWMASPTHKANILNSRYQEIGLAVVDGKLEGFDTTLVVQMFAKPRDAAVKPAVGESAIANQFQEVVVKQRTPEPAVQDTELSEELDSGAEFQPQPQEAVRPGASVLAGAMVPIGNIGQSPIFTPLQITKAFFLVVIMMIIFTLAYDSIVIGNRKTMRLVGQNLGHLILLSSVAFLLIFFKGGLIQ